MKKWKTRFTVILLVTSILLLNVLPATASEKMSPQNDDSVIVTDRIVSEEEYINAVAQSYNLSYEEAKTFINENRKAARIDPETVVDIHRSVSKKVNKDFELQCSVYMEVVRDNMNHDYIEILAVRAPNVSLVGPYVNVKMGSSALEAEVTGTKAATVYCNGTIEYTIPATVSSGFSFPGVGVSVGVGYDINYSYDVSEQFNFTI